MQNPWNLGASIPTPEEEKAVLDAIKNQERIRKNFDPFLWAKDLAAKIAVNTD